MNKNSQNKLWIALAALALLTVVLFSVQTRVFAAQIDLASEGGKSGQASQPQPLTVVLQGKLMGVNGNTWTIAGPNGTVAVQVTAQTQMKDQVAVGDVVKVQLEAGTGSTMIAHEVEKEVEVHHSGAEQETETHQSSSGTKTETEVHHSGTTSNSGSGSPAEVHQSTDHSQETEVHHSGETESHNSGSNSGGSQSSGHSNDDSHSDGSGHK